MFAMKALKVAAMEARDELGSLSKATSNIVALLVLAVGVLGCAVIALVAAVAHLTSGESA